MYLLIVLLLFCFRSVQQLSDSLASQRAGAAAAAAAGDGPVAPPYRPPVELSQTTVERVDAVLARLKQEQGDVSAGRWERYWLIVVGHVSCLEGVYSCYPFQVFLSSTTLQHVAQTDRRSASALR